MSGWVEEHSAKIGARLARELEALVAISSPSGDVAGAQECAALCATLVPAATEVERVPCSSPHHAPDLVATVRGTGTKRLLLVGHLDTVIAHDDHRPLERADGKLIGSGTVDMKGGVALSLGVVRALAAVPESFGELCLLTVVDEEWRTSGFDHGPRFAGWDACLCFEAGERTPEGDDGVVVRRKAAATLHVTAAGRAAHSGSAPDHGRNALLALAAVAQAVSTRHDPDGEHRLTAVPTVLHAGAAFNVVPPHGELFCDLRADDIAAFTAVCEAIPPEHAGVNLGTDLLRVWPGMDAREATRPVLERASEVLGRPVLGNARGGASDAAHFAAGIPIAIDGLGPLGGAAHNPDEYVLEASLVPRAEVALAVVEAVLAESGAL